MKRRLLTITMCLIFSSAPLMGMSFSGFTQQDAGHSHDAGVEKRGDHAMGFSHETTAHHFLLFTDGGVIKVETKVDHDDATRDQIRMHLAHIAEMFSANDFDIPMFIHDRVPPGVPVMKSKHDALIYKFEPTNHGGQVRITTKDPDVLRAVHDFLKFQIEDHRTGDPTDVVRTTSEIHANSE